MWCGIPGAHRPKCPVLRPLQPFRVRLPVSGHIRRPTNLQTNGAQRFGRTDASTRDRSSGVRAHPPEAACRCIRSFRPGKARRKRSNSKLIPPVPPSRNVCTRPRGRRHTPLCPALAPAQRFQDAAPGELCNPCRASRQELGAATLWRASSARVSSLPAKGVE